MKKYMLKLAALLLFTSVAFSSCSLEYRQRHMGGRDHGGDHHDDHHYDNVHRY